MKGRRRRRSGDKVVRRASEHAFAALFWRLRKRGGRCAVAWVEKDKERGREEN